MKRKTKWFGKVSAILLGSSIVLSGLISPVNIMSASASTILTV